MASPVTSIRALTKRGLFNAHAGGELLAHGVAVSSMNAGVGLPLARAALRFARMAHAAAGGRVMRAVNAAYLAVDGNAVLGSLTHLAHILRSA